MEIVLGVSVVCVTAYLCVNVWWTSRVKIAQEERRKAEAEYGPAWEEVPDVPED